MVLGKWRRRKQRGQRYAYSAWDGTQSGFELSAHDIMAELNDDLLYHGDINAALRRMMQSGFDVDGERVQGLREMLEQLREARQERLDDFDLGGVYDEVAQELREVVDTERRSLDQLAQEARESGDQRRQEITDEVVTDRNLQLDLMPPDLAGQVKELQNYEFTSSEAREKFEELMDKLREQLMQQYVDQMTDGVQNMSPEDMQRMKDMMAELNQMLEQRARGEEPDFEGFMERFGDFFPENPETLDELLEIMAQRMAAAQAMLNSMTPEQRAQLQQLADQLMEDMDLQWQAQQLAENLQQAFPDLGWGQEYQFEGQNPMGMGQAQSIFEELGDLDQLEQMLQGTSNPGALAEVDIDRARDTGGDTLGFDDTTKRQFSDVYKPIICAVNGFCIAGGMEMLLGTDIRIAAEHATFGLGEVKMGLVPLGGTHIRLPRQIPWAIAMQLLLTGKNVDAKRAYEVGLINEVVPSEELMPTALKTAERMCRNGPLAMKTAKEIAVRSLGLESGFVLEKALGARVLASDDAKEGPRAFAEKRPAKFTGR